MACSTVATIWSRIVRFVTLASWARPMRQAPWRGSQEPASAIVADWPDLASSWTTVSNRAARSLARSSCLTYGTAVTSAARSISPHWAVAFWLAWSSALATGSVNRAPTSCPCWSVVRRGAGAATGLRHVAGHRSRWSPASPGSRRTPGGEWCRSAGWGVGPMRRGRGPTIRTSLHWVLAGGVAELSQFASLSAGWKSFCWAIFSTARQA